MTPSLGKNINLSDRSILEQRYGLPGCGRGGERGKPCILSRHDGYVQNEFGTVTELAESPVLPGVLWVGTDDGNVQVSRDGGNTWTEVGKNIPNVNHEYHVSGLESSWYDAGTAYVALDGHRNDDMKPYVFKTTDFGATWTSVSGNLPQWGCVNSIRQDPVNRTLLYAPTEFGFFISRNDGQTWLPFMPNLPTFRVDEVVVHPRDRDLVLATHSRGIWIMDDISAIQNMTDQLSADSTLFKPRDAVAWRADRRNQTSVPGDKWWEGEAAPRGTAISYFLKSAQSGEVRVTITNTATGETVRTCRGYGRGGPEPLPVGADRRRSRWRRWRRWWWRPRRSRRTGSDAATRRRPDRTRAQRRRRRRSDVAAAAVAVDEAAAVEECRRASIASTCDQWAAGRHTDIQCAGGHLAEREVIGRLVPEVPVRVPHRNPGTTSERSYFAVSPGLSSRTSIPFPTRLSFSIAGVPVSSGNVPQCIGTTCRTPSHSAASAAVSGPMV